MRTAVAGTASKWSGAARLRQLVAVGLLSVSTGVFGQAAGLLAGGAETLEPMTLSVAEPLAKAPYVLKSGEYYEIDIVCDGSAELALEGPKFFRNIWIDEVVINDIEVRPLGLDSLEFDDEGTVTIKFIAIRPGSFVVRIPGTTGESQQAIFEIK